MGRGGFYQSFLREVVLPQSHRITSLFLNIGRVAFQDFLLLPSGLFDELECVKIRIQSGDLYPGASSPQPPATVFQGAPRFRRVTIPLLNDHSPLDLALAWDQLTYLALTSKFVELTDAFKILSLCTNLCECYLCLCPDSASEPPTVVPPASIQFPHLRKLGLNVSRVSLYADYFRLLAIPKLEKFAFVLSDPSAGHLKELRKTIDRLSVPDLSLVLLDAYPASRSGSFLTSIKAYQYFLPASTMELIARDACLQTHTSLMACSDTKDLIEMFRVCWTRDRQSNNVDTGIHSATIEVVDASEEHISKSSRDIAVIQKELGAANAKITLRRARVLTG